MSQRIVMKIGGTALQHASFGALSEELVGAARRDEIVVVHGGGKEVSSYAAGRGIESHFENGVRMTGAEEMAVVDMVLAGLVNKRVVRGLAALGCPAVGLSGADAGMLTGEAVHDAEGRATRTGRLAHTRPEVLRHLLGGGYLPVVASTVSAADGTPLNLNADDAALALAEALDANTLLFFSDIPGVMKGEEVVGFLDAGRVEEEIEAGTIAGGMIPKVRSAVRALDHGVDAVVIGGYREHGDLERLLHGDLGTRIAYG